MFRLAIALITTGIALPALAEPQCGPADKIMAGIKEKFQEVPTFEGLAGPKENPLPSVVTVSPDGSWTLVIMAKPGVACMVAGGTGWKSFTPTSEVIPMPEASPMEPDSIKPMPGTYPSPRNYMRAISWVK